MTMNKRPIVLLAALLLLLSFSVVAQDATGRILGTVTDQNGSVVAGAVVTVTNSGTNISAIVTADAQGFYQASTLPIGNY